MELLLLPLAFSVSVNAPVKYLFTDRLLLLGEVLGDAIGVTGKDLLPLLFIMSYCSVEACVCSHLLSSLMVKPCTILPDTIWVATRMMELPHLAASPLKPSSVPDDLIFF